MKSARKLAADHWRFVNEEESEHRQLAGLSTNKTGGPISIHQVIFSCIFADPAYALFWTTTAESKTSKNFCRTVVAALH